MKKFLFVIIMICASGASAGEFRGILKNNEGVKNFKNKRSVEAYDNFTQALGDMPFQAELHLNLGDAFSEHKEYDKAMQEFDTATRLTQSPPLKFAALYNAAEAASQKKEIDLALNYYQQALDLNPDSKEVKTNIELLLAGGQGGSGEQAQDQKKKDDQSDGGQQQQKPKQNGQGQQQQKPKPKPYNSNDVSEQDVGRILEELKRQEEDIRAKMQREGAKDVPKAKDW